MMGSESSHQTAAPDLEVTLTATSADNVPLPSSSLRVAALDGLHRALDPGHTPRPECLWRSALMLVATGIILVAIGALVGFGILW